MKQLKDKKVVLIIVTIIVLLLVGGAIFKNVQKSKEADGLIENEEVIQAVDSSVIVELVASKKQGEIEISIKNAPKGTKNAQISLSYNRKKMAYDEGEFDSIPEGLEASCEFKGGSQDCRKTGITLGTCSSGRCRYHQVIGKIKVEILFSGSYGKRRFEKEYEI